MKRLNWGGVVLAAAFWACGGSSSNPGNGNGGGGGAATLTVTVTGQGTVTSADGSVNCTASCAVPTTTGAAVHLTAAPAAGMQFTGWSGACSGTGTCDLTIAGDTQVSAVFAAGNTVLIQVQLTGGGTGTVTSTPAGINCPGTCAMAVPAGTLVQMNATAGANSTFNGWGDGCHGTTCAVTASATTQPIFADFELLTPVATQHTLTVTVAGPGTVTSTPAGISCPGTCSAKFDDGSTVALAAAPAAGATLAWSGACTGSAACSPTIAGDTAVTATFTAAAADDCAGITIPAFTAADVKTFDATDDANAVCFSANTDVAGTLYVENGNNGDIYAKGGAKVPGAFPVAFIGAGFTQFGTPLAGSDFATYQAVHADGTVFGSSQVPDVRYTHALQAGGSLVVSMFCDEANTMTTMEIIFFDDSNTRVSTTTTTVPKCIIPPGNNTFLGAEVDTAGRLLVLFNNGTAFGNVANGAYAGRWFDAAGNALTDWFSVPRAANGLALNQVIGGGLVLFDGSSNRTLIASGKAQTSPAPAFFQTLNVLSIIPGGKAYASWQGTGSPVSIVSPSGKVCGQLSVLPSTGGQPSIGRDGTLISLSGANFCTANYVPGLFK
jgi:hypothetical protein